MAESGCWETWTNQQNPDLPAIKRWLKNYDVNTIDAKGFYPIHHAVFASATTATDTTELVKLLLKQPINVNVQDPDGCTPLHTAARHGNVEIVNLLLNHEDTYWPADPEIREWLCGETPMHKAAYKYHTNRNRDGCLAVIKALVRGGQGDHKEKKAKSANLGAINYGRPGDDNDGKSPMDFLPPGILREVLDVCVVGERMNDEKADEITLTNPFHQPQSRKQTIWCSKEAGKPDQIELEPLNQGSQAGMKTNGKVEWIKGMKNPIIITQKSGMNKSNVTKVPPKDMPETTSILKLAEQEQFKGIMTHPIITSFLRKKWLEIRQVYIISCAFYLVYFGLINAYIFLDKDNSNTQAIEVMRWVSFAFLVVLSLKEAYQIVEAWSPWEPLQSTLTAHLRNLDNWLELGLIISSYLLLVPPPSCQRECMKSVKAVAILLIWLEGVFLMGNHPWFSIYRLLFLKVSKNFFKVLVWLIGFVIAFGTSFFFILSGQGLDDKGEQINPLYNTTTDAILKTIVMSFAGEPEMGNIIFPTDQAGHFSKFIFVLFVFFILLVLTNLLNGLAIEDISQLIKESAVNNEIDRLRQVHRYEVLIVNIRRIRVLALIRRPVEIVLSSVSRYFNGKAESAFEGEESKNITRYQHKWGSSRWKKIVRGKKMLCDYPQILNEAQAILDNKEKEKSENDKLRKIEKALDKLRKEIMNRFK